MAETSEKTTSFWSPNAMLFSEAAQEAVGKARLPSMAGEKPLPQKELPRHNAPLASLLGSRCGGGEGLASSLHTPRSTRQTSIASYIALKEEKQLGRLQALVFEFISLHPNCSDKQIAEGTGLTINCTTGRRNELFRAGYISPKGKAYDEKTDRNVLVWGVLR